jgi:LmbE family N-acetylglucosaminyl deacetylase
MKQKVVVVTPHPDDETLGCGGTLLKHKHNNDEIYWLIVTSMGNDYAENVRKRRAHEVEQVAACYGFHRVERLAFEPAQLDSVPLSELIIAIGEVFANIRPTTVYLPYRHDIHSDHKIVFDAASACTKWFRYPYVRRVLAYETLSETHFSINPDIRGFIPNVFVDISPFLLKKIDIMKIYESELKEHPFPRSVEAMKALSSIRGSQIGVEAAEAFMLLKESL